MRVCVVCEKIPLSSDLEDVQVMIKVRKKPNATKTLAVCIMNYEIKRFVRIGGISAVNKTLYKAL